MHSSQVFTDTRFQKSTPRGGNLKRHLRNQNEKFVITKLQKITFRTTFIHRYVQLYTLFFRRTREYLDILSHKKLKIALFSSHNTRIPTPFRVISLEENT